jgi:NTP pyrophosphatase (non-canonical NTP hydrolase)
MHRIGREPYRPIYPSDENVLGGIMPPTKYIERNKLYNRDDLNLDLEEIERQLKDRSDDLTLEDYQYWAEGNWKTKPGTYESTERFSEKLAEEYREVLEAYELLTEDQTNEKLKANLASELGDILWCISALGSNGGASIDVGLRVYLHNYILGIQIIKEGMAYPPNWQPKAAEVSTKWDKISIKDIERLIEEGFEPTPSPVMNIDMEDSSEREYGIGIHVKSILGGQLLSAAKTLAEVQYGRNEHDEYQDVSVLQSYFDSCAMRLSEIYAGTIVVIAYIASTQLNMNLSEIVQGNTNKLSTRVSKGQIDKQDAPRTGE